MRERDTTIPFMLLMMVAAQQALLSSGQASGQALASVVARARLIPRSRVALLTAWAYVVKTSSTTTRDRNLQFRGAVSTGGSPLDYLLFLQYLCAI